MPTTSQSLLSRRLVESPLSSPRTAGIGTTMTMPQTSAVKSLTVTFPTVYLDQRHGHSTLRGEYGQLFFDTNDVDKIVKRYIRTGDSELRLPVSRHPRQPDLYGQQRSDYKALHAKEMLPVRRSESLFDKEGSNINNTVTNRGEEDEFDDDFCRSRPFISFLDSLTDEELREDKDEYTYFQVDDTIDKPNAEREKMVSGAEEEGESKKVLKLRKLEIPLEEGITDEVFVDDSDMSRIKVYCIEDGNKLILVRDIKVDTSENMSSEVNGKKVTAADNEDDTKFHLSQNASDTGRKYGTTGDFVKGYNGDNEFSLSEYLKESLTQEVGKAGAAPEKHMVKHGHHKKHKHKKTTRESISPRGNMGDLDQMKFPQKPVLPAVTSPRSSASAKMDMVTTGLERKGLNAEPSGNKYKGLTGNMPHYARTTGDEEEDEASIQLRDPSQEDAGEDVVNIPDALSQPGLGEFSKENSQVTVESGLSRMQQLSVEKKLKYLEPPLYFYDPPQSRPLSMCFDYTGTHVTHAQIRGAIMKTLDNIPNAKLTSLQFIARNVLLGTIWVDNRWVVGLSTKQCMTVLLGRGIQINGEQIKLRKYDDIMRDDYDKFLLNKERFSKKGGKRQMKHAIQPQTDALSLLDRTLQDTPAKSPIDGASAEPIEAAA